MKFTLCRLLSSSLISAVLGNILPGPGSIWMEQKLVFKKPVYLNDIVTAHVEVIKIDEQKPIYTLATYCTNQHNEVVIDGQAIGYLGPTP